MRNTFKKVLVSTLVLIPAGGMPIYADDIPEAMVQEESAQTFTLLDGKTINSMIPDDVTKVVFGFEEDAEGDLLSLEDAGIFGYREEDTYFIVSSGKIVVNDPSFLFEGKENIEAIKFENFDTAEAKTLESMFSGCTALKEIDLSGVDTTAVEESKDIFKDCESLTRLILGDSWRFAEGAELEGSWKKEDSEKIMNADAFMNEYDGSLPGAYVKTAEPIAVETTSETNAEVKAEAETKTAVKTETEKTESAPASSSNHATLVETEESGTAARVQSGSLSSAAKTTTRTTTSSGSNKTETAETKTTTLKEADARKTMQETAKAFNNVIKRLSKMLEE